MNDNDPVQLKLLSNKWSVTLNSHVIIDRPALVLLLGYICLSEQPPSRHRLAEVFWPHEPSHAKRLKQLSNFLRLIRQAHPELLEVADQTIKCHVKLWCDVKALQQAYQMGALKTVMQLYQAPLYDALEDQGRFSLAERKELREWLLNERDHLMGMVLQTGLELAEGEALRGKWHAAALWAEHTYRHLDPAILNAESYERLYTVLLAGHTSASKALVSELKQRLTQENPHGMIINSKVQAKAHLSKRRNISIPLWLVGRKAEIDHVAQQLLKPTTQLVSIVGVPGVGKTIVAMHVGYNLLGRYACRQGVYWLSLAPLNDLSEVTLAIAHVLGVTLASSEDISSLVSQIKGEAMLLILDNCEHVLEAGGLIARLLQECPELNILATTREPFQLDIERVYQLEGLGYPPKELQKVNPLGVPVVMTSKRIQEEVSKYPALELFKEQAQRTVGSFELHEDVWEEVVGISQEVEGCPLALVLAASCLAQVSCRVLYEQVKMNVLVLDDLIRESRHRVTQSEISEVRVAVTVSAQAHEFLEETIGQLEVSTRVGMTSQRGIALACALSWQQLTPEEQESWQCLSVFAGGFTYEAAAAVVGVSFGVVRVLVRKSLLAWQAGRYSFHPMLHHYAHQQLAQNPEREQQINQAHAQYYLQVNDQGHWVFESNMLILEKRNIIKAWRWYVQTKQYAQMSRTLNAVDGYFFDRFSGLAEGTALMRATLASLTPLEKPMRLIQPITPFEVPQGTFLKFECLVAQVQIILASVSLRVGDFAEFERLISAATPVVKRYKDTLGYSGVLNMQGFRLSEASRLSESCEIFEEALRLPALPGHIQLLLYTNLIMHLQATGRVQEASECLIQMEAVKHDLPYGLTRIPWLRGSISRDLGDFDASEKHFVEALEYAEHYQDRHTFIYTHDEIAKLYCLLGRFEQAHFHAVAGLELSLSHFPKSNRESLRLQSTLASIYVARQTPKDALMLIDSVFAMPETITPRAAYRFAWIILEAWCQQGRFQQGHNLICFLLMSEHKERLDIYTRKELARILWCYRFQLEAHAIFSPTYKGHGVTLELFLAQGPAVFEAQSSASLGLITT